MFYFSLPRAYAVRHALSQSIHTFFLAGTIILGATLFSLNAHAQLPASTKYTGINIGGAALGAGILPGKNGVNYLWATPEELVAYANAGFNIVRVPFLWERMQPDLFAPLNGEELSRLDVLVQEAKNRDISIILDIHNYGKYRGELIGSDTVPTSAFVDLWTRLSSRYAQTKNVWFGLMNEPHKHTADTWAPIVQAAIYAIRKSGATQEILVPSSPYSGAHTWLKKNGTKSNAESLVNLVDPVNNYTFEFHQYFDSNTSGTSPKCDYANVGIDRISDTTDWLRRNKKTGFLGEFGASSEPVCLAALENTLRFMKDNSDVWSGWTYWVSVKWMPNYFFNIPVEGMEKSPQYKVLNKFLAR